MQIEGAGVGFLKRSREVTALAAAPLDSGCCGDDGFRAPTASIAARSLASLDFTKGTDVLR